ncbi:uncharacterized protein B0H18DRAFT_1120956 [Fomitopsis serialis]|uniref:uncharacterized protein n=1 Tax=Fomitopsis serialis TaxID=139415 RepID=UPI002008679C|nr:uncharacterized protein B0H18DRAFT_1120956 [Neoantrodia serialis]KAH9922402.1 hypothetical protein B0H18DRAFT_1120956 [Neoantrodia serialis]
MATAKFVELSARFYPTEKERQDVIRPVLNLLLGEGALDEKPCSTGSVTDKPDGGLAAKCGLYTPLDQHYSRMLKLIVELKNGIGLGDCCPTEQAEKAYQLTCIDSKLDDLRHCSCMPAFILAIAAPHISVSGAIFVHGVAISQRITPLVSLVLPLPCLCTTPSFGANELGFVTAGTQHYRDMQRPTSLPGRDELSPAPCFLSYEVNNDAASRRDGQAGPPSSSRPLPKANGGGENGTRCVVKFVHRYGKKAHEFMYERGVAARLMYCQKEASVGGLFVVITEYIDEVENAKASQDGITKLRDALEGLREAQLVFGDLRRVNMLVDSTGQPRLIDFDWSGPDGDMRYPHDLNHDIPWQEEARPCGFITKEHYMVMLEKLVSELGK